VFSFHAFHGTSMYDYLGHFVNSILQIAANVALI